MKPEESARYIQRYLTEALSGLQTHGNDADVEARIIDARALAHDIEKDLQNKQEITNSKTG